MIVSFFIWSDIDGKIEGQVRGGHMVNDLLKPFKTMYIYFFNNLGVSLLSIILETIPLFLLGMIFFKVEIAPLLYFVMFFVSIVLALIINFLISQ